MPSGNCFFLCRRTNGLVRHEVQVMSSINTNGLNSIECLCRLLPAMLWSRVAREYRMHGAILRRLDCVATSPPTKLVRRRWIRPGWTPAAVILVESLWNSTNSYSSLRKWVVFCCLNFISIPCLNFISAAAACHLSLRVLFPIFPSLQLPFLCSVAKRVRYIAREVQTSP